jgi:large subunit ribosomal protein L10
MNKEQKQAAIEEIGEQLEASSAVFAVDYRGISVPQAAELRGRLGEADATFNVVKNRLAKRVVADAGAEALDEHLVGPTALTYVRGDAVLAAKAISQFSKEHSVLAYKGGIMDGAALDPEQFNAIARLPGLDVLHGQLVGLAAAPLTGVVRSLNGLIQGLATQLGQISEQGLVGGDAPAEEVAPEPKPEPDADPPAEEAASAEGEEAAEADESPGETTDDANDEGPAAEADDSAEPGPGDEQTEPKED